ncbi:MAG: cytochrome P450 [Candidatus Binatia bacterium]
MDYNPFLPDVQYNPFPYYAYLRQHAPVYQVPGVGFWAISRYDDVLSVLKNHQLFSSGGFVSAVAGESNPWPPQAPAMLEIDPPDHTRLRKLANRAFTPRRVASLERHVREVTRQLLGQIPTHGVFDLVQELSAPLPTIVIAELLGVPPQQRHDFKRWTEDTVKSTTGAALTPEDRAQIRQSMAEFRAYFLSALEGYRQEPGDNLLSDLVRAEEEQQRLTGEEILSLAILLLIAGSETTTNLIGHAMLALLNQPQDLAKVRANPALIPNMLEETLRYDGPIQLFPRQTMQEVELAGTVIPAGSMVLALIGSANRDEGKFPEPDRFDITRNTEGHVGFGFGVHFCLGAQLARLEGRVVVEEILRRFSHIERKEEHVTRVESLLFRGLKTLPLVVG